jgi:hypothetical protein
VADPDVDAALLAFRRQHRDDRACGAVAEQLAERLLVIFDAMALHESDEITLRVAAERRLAEGWIAGQKTIRRNLQIGEIAASAPGDQDFGPDPVGMIEQQDPAASLAGRQGAHQTRRAGPHDNDVERLYGSRHSFSAHMSVVPVIGL